MDELDFEALKNQYGEILVLEADDGKIFVFKKAELPIVKRYFDMMTTESLFDAAKALELDLVVIPSADEFAGYIFKNPCVVMDLMPAMRNWIGSKIFKEKKV